MAAFNTLSDEKQTSAFRATKRSPALAETAAVINQGGTEQWSAWEVLASRRWLCFHAAGHPFAVPEELVSFSAVVGLLMPRASYFSGCGRKCRLASRIHAHSRDLSTATRSVADRQNDPVEKRLLLACLCFPSSTDPSHQRRAANLKW